MTGPCLPWIGLVDTRVLAARPAVHCRAPQQPSAPVALQQLPCVQDRYNAGLILEYSWHIIFGEPPVYHAPPKCELLHCSTQEDYVIPLNTTSGSTMTNGSTWADISHVANVTIPITEQRHGSRLARQQQRVLRQQQHQQKAQQDQQQVGGVQQEKVQSQ